MRLPGNAYSVPKFYKCSAGISSAPTLTLPLCPRTHLTIRTPCIPTLLITHHTTTPPITTQSQTNTRSNTSRIHRECPCSIQPGLKQDSHPPHSTFNWTGAWHRLGDSMHHSMNAVRCVFSFWKILNRIQKTLSRRRLIQNTGALYSYVLPRHTLQILYFYT